jgi:hypothetical protein
VGVGTNVHSLYIATLQEEWSASRSGHFSLSSQYVMANGPQNCAGTGSVTLPWEIRSTVLLLHSEYRVNKAGGSDTRIDKPTWQRE